MPDVACLELRAQVLRRIRAFFDARGFVEVETPVRIAAPAPEPHIDCPPVATGGFLRASPELQMKKLLAVGMDRIWQMGPCFREGEKGSRHNPEFTMLEWYRAHADYLDILADMEALVTEVLAACGSPGRFALPESRNPAGRTALSRCNPLGRTAPFLCSLLGRTVLVSRTPEGGFLRMTVREAYRRYAGWDPFEDWDQDRFDFDMATKIEPNLPREPTFLMDYPPQAASLSKLRGDVAERWELYVDGMELANAFTELTDTAEQRRRFEAARAERRRLGEADYPLDEEFLRLLQFMPPAGGVALGVDRLVMLTVGAKSLDEIRMLA